MQFNVPIILKRITLNEHSEPLEATAYQIKCALMGVTKKPEEKNGSIVMVKVVTVMVPHKGSEPYNSIQNSQMKQLIYYDGMDMRIQSIETIPGFNGSPKFYEIVMKEIIGEF